MSAEHTPTPPAPADDAKARIDEDGCCVGCGRSVQPSPCCPDYPADDAKRCCESPVLLCATCGTAQGYGGPADDATRGCTVAFCETHRDVEIVPGPFCPSCLGSDCRVDGMRDGLRARRADDASGAEAIAPVWRVELWAEQIRVAWVDWALTQPNPKPSWLVPWATLDEQSKDADRAIARRLLALYGAPLPARDDAVEEARSKVVEAAVAWCAPNADDGMTDMLLDAVNKYAALRREKGG